MGRPRLDCRREPGEGGRLLRRHGRRTSSIGPGNNLDPEMDVNDPASSPERCWSSPAGSVKSRTSIRPRITRANPAVARILGAGACGSIYDGPTGTGSFAWPTPLHYLSGFDLQPGAGPPGHRHRRRHGSRDHGVRHRRRRLRRLEQLWLRQRRRHRPRQRMANAVRTPQPGQRGLWPGGLSGQSDRADGLHRQLLGLSSALRGPLRRWVRQPLERPAVAQLVRR